MKFTMQFLVCCAMFIAVHMFIFSLPTTVLADDAKHSLVTVFFKDIKCGASFTYTNTATASSTTGQPSIPIILERNPQASFSLEMKDKPVIMHVLDYACPNRGKGAREELLVNTFKLYGKIIWTKGETITVKNMVAANINKSVVSYNIGAKYEVGLDTLMRQILK